MPSEQESLSITNHRRDRWKQEEISSDSRADRCNVIGSWHAASLDGLRFGPLKDRLMTPAFGTRKS
ncbi:MAG: hypothetical protein BGO04_03685 [Microbacterium sp. 70-38]|nr:MAG: hypothetical protein BGO04_03685 [Microbacterium sp. 70-38]